MYLCLELSACISASLDLPVSPSLLACLSHLIDTLYLILSACLSISPDPPVSPSLCLSVCLSHLMYLSYGLSAYLCPFLSLLLSAFCLALLLGSASVWLSLSLLFSLLISGCLFHSFIVPLSY